MVKRPITLMAGQSTTLMLFIKVIVQIAILRVSSLLLRKESGVMEQWNTLSLI